MSEEAENKREMGPEQLDQTPQLESPKSPKSQYSKHILVNHSKRLVEILDRILLTRCS